MQAEMQPDVAHQDENDALLSMAFWDFVECARCHQPTLGADGRQLREDFYLTECKHIACRGCIQTATSTSKHDQAFTCPACNEPRDHAFALFEACTDAAMAGNFQSPENLLEQALANYRWQTEMLQNQIRFYKDAFHKQRTILQSSKGQIQEARDLKKNYETLQQDNQALQREIRNLKQQLQGQAHEANMFIQPIVHPAQQTPLESSRPSTSMGTESTKRVQIPLHMGARPTSLGFKNDQPAAGMHSLKRRREEEDYESGPQNTHERASATCASTYTPFSVAGMLQEQLNSPQMFTETDEPPVGRPPDLNKYRSQNNRPAGKTGTSKMDANQPAIPQSAPPKTMPLKEGPAYGQKPSTSFPAVAGNTRQPLQSRDTFEGTGFQRGSEIHQGVEPADRINALMRSSKAGSGFIIPSFKPRTAGGAGRGQGASEATPGPPGTVQRQGNSKGGGIKPMSVSKR